MRQYISLSEEYKVIPKLDTNYDLYVLGSDQIWNPKLTYGISDLFWGNFKIKDSAKMITYGASSSYYSYNDWQLNKISEILPKYSAVSVRESELKEYLKVTFDVESELVCDPTMLVDGDVWDKLAIEPQEKGYVLTYFTTPETLRIANDIAKRKGLKVISIYNIYDKVNSGFICSPDEFVGLFKYADYVVSCSFHGLIFSLLFNREFCAVGSGISKDSRMISVLAEMGIEGRFIVKDDGVDKISDIKIDYEKVNSLIEKFRIKSRKFITENI